VPDGPAWSQEWAPLSIESRLAELVASVDTLPIEARDRLRPLLWDKWTAGAGNLRGWAFVTTRQDSPGMLLAFGDRITVATPRRAGGTDLVHLLAGQYPDITVHRSAEGRIEALSIYNRMAVLGSPAIAERFVETVRACPWLTVNE
jgi:hypothetical protein